MLEPIEVGKYKLFTLYKNGDFMCGPFFLSQGSSLRSCVLGSIVIDKLVGEGNPITLKSMCGELIITLRYKGGKWYKKEPENACESKLERKKTDVSGI